MLRAYIGLIKKEFRQVFRDANMLRIVFAVPIIQLLVLGYAVNVDVKRLNLDVYDFDRTEASRGLVESMRAGDYFVPMPQLAAEDGLPLWELETRFRSGASEMAVIIPDDFSERLKTGEDVTVGWIADGADANAARTGVGYATQILVDHVLEESGRKQSVSLGSQFLYNPEAESVYYMVPGIVATLLTMITIMLTSMAIVREREMGTLEQLMVTPISASALILGKITAFAILGFVEMAVTLIIGTIWFGIPFVGSPLLLFGLAAVYLVATLGLGLLFSTMTSTQQQAMFMAWFFSVFAILTSGFFTPVHNMPQWTQYITYLNPMRYFMAIVRGIMMKGAGIGDLLSDILPMALFAVGICTIAVLRFSKRVS